MSAATLAGFAGHDIRLAWRDFAATMSAGRRGRARYVLLALVVFVAILHLPAWAMVGSYAGLTQDADRASLIVIAATVALSWLLMLSQAIESVTRVFYARADLDLIMSSPVPLERVFSVRMAAIALTVTAMALLFAAPVVDVLALAGGAHWLSAFGVVAAIGVSASAMAILLAVALFRLIGPRRTRLAAQILSVVIGAGFVIGLQVAAILSTGTLSRFTLLTSDAVAAWAPAMSSVLWWPARAVLGDGIALAALLGASLALLGLVMILVAPMLGDLVVDVASVAVTTRKGKGGRFRRRSRQQALRIKEFTLLRRDPWLVSQSLMQLLYLIPPALLLWRSFSDSSGAVVLITPVIVMAAGQLAGGLAWLTMSGEDAPDLVATAPLPPSAVMRARIEVVLMGIALVVTPLLLPLAWLSPLQALVTAAGCAIAATSATAIQLWFRVQARRSQFRRRQTSSRIATFAEAFVSIGWAATAALALTIPLVALISAAFTLGVLALTWSFSPRRAA
ncbi:permease [Rhodopseudomonas palustris]|uniref:permease n=1 Tax=Rhodopseudomonas palustris TaxID=1076 RepID=UPI002ACED150|nr:permease [Rhodopseudomonas palustris]WQG99227.1 permease [Rhodopseudomonas palustris]